MAQDCSYARAELHGGWYEWRAGSTYVTPPDGTAELVMLLDAARWTAELVVKACIVKDSSCSPEATGSIG